MEDKRTAIAVLVCIMVVMFYSEAFLAPYTRPRQIITAPATDSTLTQATQSNSGVNQSQKTSLPNSIPNQKTSPQISPAIHSDLPTAPSKAEYDSHETSIIESEQIKVSINHLGARITSFQLLQHTITLGDKTPLDMIAIEEGGSFPGGLSVAGLTDDRVAYTLVASTEGAKRENLNFRIPYGTDLFLKFSGKLSNGNSIEKTYTFTAGSYLFSVQAQIGTPTADGSPVRLEWPTFIPDNLLTSRIDIMQFTSLGENNKIQHILVGKDTISENAPTILASQWISLGEKYFMSLLIPEQKGNNSRIRRSGQTYISSVDGNPSGGKFELFVGPKEHTALTKAGHQLERTVDLGWFAFLAYPLLWLLRFFYLIFGNYGLAIILLTLVIKALFLPLTKASFKSMGAMQDLQPEMKALRERIKDSNQLNQEMMALYKKRGVNPMGGCFPMLIQIPVFLGLYNALLNSIELRHAPFALWITDLSSPESLLIFGISVPVMVLIWGLSMYVQQYTTPSIGDPMQRKIMLMMPVVFTIMFIVLPFPAGLVLYWLVNNAISIVQQIHIRTDRKAGPFGATVIASIVIFCFGYVLTLL